MNTSPRQLRGWAWAAARAAWWVLLAASVVVIVGGLALDPSFAPVVGWPPDTYRAAAAQLGVSPQGLDSIHLIVASLTRLGYLLIGGLVFWRRGRDPVGWFTSVFLVTFSVTAAFLGETVQSTRALAVPLELTRVVGQACMLLFAFVFPDGRFVPTWTRWPTLGSAVILSLGRLPVLQTNPIYLALGILALLWTFGAVPAQIYRYRHVADPIQRQQIKWGLLGILGLVGLQGGLWVIFGYTLPQTLPALQATSGGTLLYQFVRNEAMAVSALLLPIGLGVAVLRYRLWDIDVIVRRTLIYSVLTAVLALTYLGSVLVLENLFRALTGQGQNSLVVVLSTLAIAALFGPVRVRVQHAIDRRFFRRKYDAAQTLAGFAASARDETDLERLSEHLVGVVDNTMQPESLGLWLRTGETNSTYHQPGPGQTGAASVRNGLRN
jgi:hypothetical protein